MTKCKACIEFNGKQSGLAHDTSLTQEEFFASVIKLRKERKQNCTCDKKEGKEDE